LAAVSANVHVVSRPTSTVTLLTLALAASYVPVAVFAWRVQVAPVSNHDDGTVSPTEYALPVATTTGLAVPVPLDVVMERAIEPGLTAKSNVPSPPVVCFTMLRKPPPGVTMQSDGSLFAPLAADG
jgi:hypothetical protein